MMHKPKFDGRNMTEPPILTFQIPSNPADADSLAGDLGELVRSSEWKRAALIHARVQVSGHGGDRSKITSDLATPSAYAKLGIVGLRSPTTIRAYWQAWQNAVDDGIVQPAILGKEIHLPRVEWNEYYPPKKNAVTTPEPIEPPHDIDAVGCTIADSDTDTLEDNADTESLDDTPHDMLEECRVFIADTVQLVKQSTTTALEWVNRHVIIDDGPERAAILQEIEMASAALDALKRVIIGETISDSDLYRVTDG